jgi:hypothetical protein
MRASFVEEQGHEMRWVSAAMLGAVLAAAAIGCQPVVGAPAVGVCEPGNKQTPFNCYSATNAGEAATFAGTSAVVWTIAGCKLAGCAPPLMCNRDSGFCERPRCDESLACPNNTTCNLRTRLCEP